MVAERRLTDDGETYPLVVLVGPTATGKTSLALHLAQTLQAEEKICCEIVSCDAVAVYRGMDIGSAKPSTAERALVPHHGLDLLEPDEPSTAGDYARAVRSALGEIKSRGHLPIVTGGTGLYLRALLEGLAPAPARDEDLRERLRGRAARRESGHLHRLLQRLDPAAAALIHSNDTPKLVRSLEVTLTARQRQSEQWRAGRDPLQGFHVLRLGLNPPREALYERINARAAAMFAKGLLEETAALHARFGDGCRALGSLGYAQAVTVLRGKMTLEQAVAAAQQGHRNYAKRQLTWFRRDAAMEWFEGFGDDAVVRRQMYEKVLSQLRPTFDSIR